MCKCFRDSYVPFKYFGIWYDQKQGFPGGESGKEPACQYRRRKRCRFDPRVGKISWRRTWQPTPVSLPGEFHRQRSLASCSPRVTQSGTQLNRLSTHAHNQEHLLSLWKSGIWIHAWQRLEEGPCQLHPIKALGSESLVSFPR